MEASVANLFSPGDKVLVINGGKFGERWLNIANAFGFSPIELEVEWGQAVEVDSCREADESPSRSKGCHDPGQRNLDNGASSGARRSPS